MRLRARFPALCAAVLLALTVVAAAQNIIGGGVFGDIKVASVTPDVYTFGGYSTTLSAASASQGDFYATSGSTDVTFASPCCTFGTKASKRLLLVTVLQAGGSGAQPTNVIICGQAATQAAGLAATIIPSQWVLASANTYPTSGSNCTVEVQSSSTIPYMAVATATVDYQSTGTYSFANEAWAVGLGPASGTIAWSGSTSYTLTPPAGGIGFLGSTAANSPTPTGCSITASGWVKDCTTSSSSTTNGIASGTTFFTAHYAGTGATTTPNQYCTSSAYLYAGGNYIGN